MVCAAGTPAADDENPCDGRLRQPAARPRRRAVRGRGRLLRHGVRQPRGARAVRAHRRRAAERLGPRTHAEGRLRAQPPAARGRGGAAHARRRPTRRARTTSRRFRWDLDNDGEFDDATGRSISHTYTRRRRGGRRPRGLEARTATSRRSTTRSTSCRAAARHRRRRPPPTPSPTDHDRRPGPARHDPQRPPPEGPPRPLLDPRALRAHRPARHRRDRGLPREPPHRHRPHARAPRRHEARQRPPHPDRPAAAAPRRRRPHAGPRARARRAQRAALEAR